MAQWLRLCTSTAGAMDLIPGGLPWWLRWWRICLQCRRPGFSPWVEKIPWRRTWQPTLVFLPGELHGQRSLVGYSMGDGKEVDTAEWLTLFWGTKMPVLLQGPKKKQKDKQKAGAGLTAKCRCAGCGQSRGPWEKRKQVRKRLWSHSWGRSKCERSQIQKYPKTSQAVYRSPVKWITTSGCWMSPLDDGNVLKLDSSDACTNLNILKTPKLYISNRLTLWCVNYVSIKMFCKLKSIRHLPK